MHLYLIYRIALCVFSLIHYNCVNTVRFVNVFFIRFGIDSQATWHVAVAVMIDKLRL